MPLSVQAQQTRESFQARKEMVEEYKQKMDQIGENFFKNITSGVRKFQERAKAFELAQAKKREEFLSKQEPPPPGAPKPKIRKYDSNGKEIMTGAQETKSTPNVGVDDQAVPTKGGHAPPQTGGITRPQYELDGSKVPAALEFKKGEKKPAANSAPKLAPKDLKSKKSATPGTPSAIPSMKPAPKKVEIQESAPTPEPEASAEPVSTDRGTVETIEFRKTSGAEADQE